MPPPTTKISDRTESTIRPPLHGRRPCSVARTRANTSGRTATEERRDWLSCRIEQQLMRIFCVEFRQCDQGQVCELPCRQRSHFWIASQGLRRLRRDHLQQ